MSIISTFYGVIIQMFWGEHPSPHFHALYAEYEAIIEIKTLEVIKGHLPKGALMLVLEWTNEHRADKY